MSKYQVIIGRAAAIDIVGYAIGVPAKVDSGAFRSAIHASKIKVTQKDGKKILSCELLGHPCSPISRKFQTDKFDVINVRSSSGHEEDRYEVKIKVKIGPKIFISSFTLTDRSSNIYPVLIGRKALMNRFIVDVSKNAVNRMALKKLRGVTSPEDEEDLE